MADLHRDLWDSLPPEERTAGEIGLLVAEVGPDGTSFAVVWSGGFVMGQTATCPGTEAVPQVSSLAAGPGGAAGEVRLPLAPGIRLLVGTSAVGPAIAWLLGDEPAKRFAAPASGGREAAWVAAVAAATAASAEAQAVPRPVAAPDRSEVGRAALSPRRATANALFAAGQGAVPNPASPASPDREPGPGTLVVGSFLLLTKEESG
ncbi:MAG: hypothetical protein GX442_16700 [Candidatus Riflebacteria bacterium]|nr:hypothetical protein [Candidatus Riflebacteria bacterium]